MLVDQFIVALDPIMKEDVDILQLYPLMFVFCGHVVYIFIYFGVLSTKPTQINKH